jgi:hypothetical protein
MNILLTVIIGIMLRERGWGDWGLVIALNTVFWGSIIFDTYMYKVRTGRGE